MLTGGGFVVLPVTLLIFGILTRSITLTDRLPVAGFGLLILVLIIIILPRLPMVRGFSRNDRMIQEFLEVSHPISLVVIAFLGSIVIAVLLMYAPTVLTFWLLTVIILMILVGLGTQSGQIDSQERILTYSHGTGETVLELDYLTDVSRWTVGK